MKQAMRRRGLLVVLSGPAGSGKSSLAEKVMQKHPDICRAITATTRPPRSGEKDGIDYFFLAREEFEKRIARGEFVEHAEFNGQLYGTPRSELERHLTGNRIVFLVIDVQGARAIRDQMLSALLIFVLPPSMEVLRQRLYGRGTENVTNLENRLSIARREVRELDNYDYLVINDDLDAAASELLALVTMARAHHVRGSELEAWEAGRYRGWHAKPEAEEPGETSV